MANASYYKRTYGEKKVNDHYMLGLKLKSAGIFVVCVILALICILPLWIVIVNATRSNAEIVNGLSLIPSTNFGENISNLIAKEVYKPGIGFKNSAIITVGATVLSVFFSSLTAYGLVVYDFKLKDAAWTFILAVLMVPVQVSGVGFIKFMISLGLYNTFVPLIVPAIAAPGVVFFMRQYMKSSFPLEIVEAARIDGCSEFRTFFTIGLPMIKPAVAVQAIFAFIANWNNFYTPSMIIVSEDKKTLPMMMSALTADRVKTDYGIVYVGIALSIVPLIVVYLILSKYIIAGVALGGVKE